MLALAAIGCGASVGSIGAVLGRDNDTHALYVREAPRGMAAAEAGLQPGDEILMVDGFYVKDMSVKQLQALLRGEVGSTVELTVARSGAVRHVKLKRSLLRQHEVKPKEETLEE